MNSLIIVTGCGVLFLFGYAVYSRLVERIFKIDPKRKTPAYRKYDGVDFVPAKHWSILFGHHFASIAGAAPIVGPILAISIWGWGPALVWVVLGTVFIGGIHDFCSLIISVRHDGSSVADVAEDVISKRAKVVFLAFVWLTLILVISVFVNICARTFVVKPEIVIPSVGLVPIALVAGVMLYRLKFRQPITTVLALAMLAGAIFLGKLYPVALGKNALMIWNIALFAYAFVASIMPVNILLQPRDYLSSFLLVLGIAFGYAGIFMTQPELNFPMFLGWAPKESLRLWPILFVTVACGAVSGFHSIVASGTTSKQITNEKDDRKIGYGAAIAEGILAVMAVILIAAAFSDKLMLKEVVEKGAGPVGAFGIGYSEITKGFLGVFGGLFAMIVLNSFILTTLDTATRICRYLTQELFKIKSRFTATAIVVALSAWLGLSGAWSEIWLIFGSANQLIAALTLIVITSWFLSKKKVVMYTLVPAVFMLVTAMGALVSRSIEYANGGKNILFIFTIVLMALGVFVLLEAFIAIFKIFRSRKRSLRGVKK